MIDDPAYGATVAKRRLSSRLGTLRVRARMSPSEASDKLGWKRGRLNRFERNEWRQPAISSVRDLARIYGASDDEREELEQLVARASVRTWWHEADKEREKVFSNEFPGFENDAARISLYLPLVLPGLMQTRAYIEAILAAGRGSAQWRERALQARLRRQQILDRTDGTAPQVAAVITEAALLYQWGTPSDRRTQLGHLAALSARPNIELRLLRFAGGLHPGMCSAIDIFDFPGHDDPSVVYLENDTGIHEVTKPADIQAYQQTFARIRDSALAPTATRTYLHQLSNSLEGPQ